MPGAHDPSLLPGTDLYGRHLGHPEGVDGVYRLRSGPADRGAPPAFTRTWLRTRIDDIDVVHVHGLPAGTTPQEVADCVSWVHDAGRPLVVTAYHLDDPTGRDPARYAAALDVLIPRADAVLTLTAPAAEELEQRWGVQAMVTPHPHAVDFAGMRRERPPPPPGRLLVGVDLARLDVPVDPVLLVDALTRAVSEVPGARLVVDLNEAILNPDIPGDRLGMARELERRVRSRGAVLRVHRPFTEPQQWGRLHELDVSVLPGLFGSHSPWPEACADLGTHAVLPAGSHASAQQPGPVFDADADGDNLTESLAAALLDAAGTGPRRRSDPAQRWDQRVAGAETLRRLYEHLGETSTR
ncbi:MAG: glycosyltransferase [Kineosporiaceae bacterium]